MANLNIETSQNVKLELVTASAGDRVLAFLIDLVICVIYLISFLKFASSILFNDIDELNVVIFLIFYAPIAFYDPIFEFFAFGQTPGKMLMKIRVMSIDGSKESIGQIILRWLIKLADMYPLSLLVLIFRDQLDGFTQNIFWLIPIPISGILFMVISKKNQRLGDIVANTIVIKKMPPLALNETILKVLPKDYQPTFHNVLELSDNDIGIIKETMDNSLKYDNSEYLKKVADKVKELLKIQTKMSPKKFLDTVIKDYNYLALEAERDEVY